MVPQWVQQMTQQPVKIQRNKKQQKTEVHSMETSLFILIHDKDELRKVIFDECILL